MRTTKQLLPQPCLVLLTLCGAFHISSFPTPPKRLQDQPKRFPQQPRRDPRPRETTSSWPQTLPEASKGGSSPESDKVNLSEPPSFWASTPPSACRQVLKCLCRIREAQTIVVTLFVRWVFLSSKLRSCSGITSGQISSSLLKLVRPGALNYCKNLCETKHVRKHRKITFLVIRARSSIQGFWRPCPGDKCYVESVLEVNKYQSLHPEKTLKKGILTILFGKHPEILPGFLLGVETT